MVKKKSAYHAKPVAIFEPSSNTMVEPIVPEQSDFRLYAFQGTKMLFNLDGTYQDIPESALKFFEYTQTVSQNGQLVEISVPYSNGHEEARLKYEKVQATILQEELTTGERAKTKELTPRQAIDKTIWQFLFSGNQYCEDKEGNSWIIESAIGFYTRYYTTQAHGKIKFALSHRCNVKLQIANKRFTLRWVADMFNDPLYQDFPEDIMHTIEALRAEKEAKMWEQIEELLARYDLYSFAKEGDLNNKFAFISESKAKYIRYLLYSWGLKYRLPKGDESDDYIAHPLNSDAISDMCDFIDLYKVGFDMDVTTHGVEHYYEAAHQFDARTPVGGYVREYNNDLDQSRINDYKAFKMMLSNRNHKMVDVIQVIITYGTIQYYLNKINQGSLDINDILIENHVLCPVCGVPLDVRHTRCKNCETPNADYVKLMDIMEYQKVDLTDEEVDDTDYDIKLTAEDYMELGCDLEECQDALEYDATYEAHLTVTQYIEDDIDFYERKYTKEYMYNNPITTYYKKSE